jgi:hypothetical protein
MHTYLLSKDNLITMMPHNKNHIPFRKVDLAGDSPSL